MNLTQQLLFDEVIKLPADKIGKALSFIRFLTHEPEVEIIIDSDEENVLQQRILSDDFINASDVLAKIEALPND